MLIFVTASSLFVFFCKQKTAYEMRISDWSSDVCSSDLILGVRAGRHRVHAGRMRARGEVVDQRRGGVLHDHEAGIGAVLVAGEEGRQAVVGGGDRKSVV